LSWITARYMCYMRISDEYDEDLQGICVG